MMFGSISYLRCGSLGLGLMCLFLVGCTSTRIAAHRANPPISLPPVGSVPSELGMVNLPEYVIEPPDVLIINAVLREVDDTQKAKDGKDDKEQPVTYKNTVLNLPIQPVEGEYPVRPDGTIFLGVYGSVPVAGYTLQQAAAAIRSSLAKQISKDSGGTKEETLLVVADVSQYNSKYYYVVTDGAGSGEQVVKFPITGKETVFDAIANIGGLPEVSSKRNIWVARRTPYPNQPQQILPVDWVGITQHGVSLTNWQIFPGDRVYVKAQRLVTMDRTLAKILSPVERLFGVTLLGASTVNQISGRGPGFGNVR